MSADILSVVVGLFAIAALVLAWKCIESAGSVARAAVQSRADHDKASNDLMVRMHDRMLSACGVALKAREIEAEVEKAIADGTGRPMEEVKSERDQRFDGILVPGENDPSLRNGTFSPIG